jgi:hypothetical protein
MEERNYTETGEKKVKSVGRKENLLTVLFQYMFKAV